MEGRKKPVKVKVSRAHEVKMLALWPVCRHAKSLQLCLILCDCNPPGSSADGILQARMLEWVAMPSSRGSSRDGTLASDVSCIGREVLYH